MFYTRVAGSTWKTGGLGGRSGRLKTMRTRALVCLAIQKWDHGRSKLGSDNGWVQRVLRLRAAAYDLYREL
jgi:hypothetical protein